MRGGRLHLLPCLPEAWPDGDVKGLRARGGFIVDLRWSGGELIEGVIQATVDASCRVRYRDHEESLDLRAGETRRLAF